MRFSNRRSQLHTPELANRTIRIADALMPPDIDWRVKTRSMDDRRTKVFLLAEIMEKISTEDTWREFLSVAENGSLADFENQYTQQVGGGKRE
jgi:hypothetical protein